MDLKKNLKHFLYSSFGVKRGLEGGWLEKFRLKMGTLNLYGRIVTKKVKGCSYFYELLCANYKSDGWVIPELKLIAEMADYELSLIHI